MMTPQRPQPLSTLSVGPAEEAGPGRRRWSYWGLVVALVVLAAAYWPRRQRIMLLNGSTLDVVKVTIGPRHTCAIPVTMTNIKAAVARRRFHWPQFETFEADNTVGLWFEKPARGWDDALYLVDRNGWHWAPLSRSREPPILFPPMDHRSPLNVLAVARGTFYARSPLVIPAGARPRNDWNPDPLPVQRTDGPLAFELKGFEVTVPTKVPSAASVQLKMKMSWNGHAFRADFVSPSLTDTRGRTDEPDIAPDGVFTTHISPYDTLWQLQFLVGRDREQPLDADEEIFLEPEWSGTDNVRIWDETVAGIPCRFAVSRSADKINVSSLLPRAGISWRALGAKVMAEPEPGSGALVRIDFLDLDGQVIHRGIVEKLVTTGDRRLTPRVYGANSGAIKLPDRYRIRVGIDVPRPVVLTLRPDVNP